MLAERSAEIRNDAIAQARKDYFLSRAGSPEEIIDELTEIVNTYSRAYRKCFLALQTQADAKSRAIAK